MNPKQGSKTRKTKPTDEDDPSPQDVQNIADSEGDPKKTSIGLQLLLP